MHPDWERFFNAFYACNKPLSMLEDDAQVAKWFEQSGLQKPQHIYLGESND